MAAVLSGTLSVKGGRADTYRETFLKVGDYLHT